MNYRISRAALISVCAVLILLGAVPAARAFVPRVGYGPDAADGIVTINDRTAVRFRKPNAGLTTVDRARLTAGRLKLLAYGGWKGISTRAVGKTKAEVVAGSQVICIATKADAKAAGTSALSLAQMWASGIKRLFAMPAVTVNPGEIVVPENENRQAEVGGAATGPAQAHCSNPRVATTKIDPATGKLVVFGKSLGRCEVQVMKEGSIASLVVNVRRYAGRVTPTPAMVEVTGTAVPSSLLELAASQVASQSVAVESGAKVRYGKPNVQIEQLAQGKSIRAFVPVSVTGEGLIPTELQAPVDIYNRLVSYKPVAGLFYSNNPERVTNFGTLFVGKLSFDERQRLFYHHLNMVGKTMRIQIELVNVGDTQAQVQTVSGTTVPHKDPVAGGYFAGLSFIRDYLNDVGRIRRIPPRTSMVIASDVTAQEQTASGIIDLRQIVGGDVYVRVTAMPLTSGASDGAMANVDSSEIPVALSDHIYEAPSKDVTGKYVVGERWEFIRIGKNPIKNTDGTMKLEGNYGVIYDVRVRVENPTPDTKIVKAIFEPTAGPASGIFIVDGRVIGVKVVFPPNEFEITRVKLDPGQSKDLLIRTIPLGGSAYPATIVIKS